MSWTFESYHLARGNRQGGKWVQSKKITSIFMIILNLKSLANQK